MGVINAFADWFEAFAGVANRQNSYMVPREIPLPDLSVWLKRKKLSAKHQINSKTEPGYNNPKDSVLCTFCTFKLQLRSSSLQFVRFIFVCLNISSLALTLLLSFFLSFHTVKFIIV